MVFDFVPYQRVFFGACVSLFLLLAWLSWQSWHHRQQLKKIRWRIHIAGSRGKTTTTRLIGAALRQDGHRVLVKTTGTVPLVILPDGTEQPWKRWGPATITELIRLVRLANRYEVDILVLESMAIAPEYLWASERYLVQASHVVVTNVRQDHTEVLGEHPEAMAQALSLLIPSAQNVFLTQEAARSLLTDKARALNNTLHIVPAPLDNPLRANECLATAVCLSLGLEKAVIKRGFQHAGRDPGGFQIQALTLQDKTFLFHDAFSCNDLVSLKQLWEAYAQDDLPTVFFNPRADRPDRTQEFLQFLPQLHESLVIIYNGKRLPRWLKLSSQTKARIYCIEAQGSPETVLNTMVSYVQGTQVWGVGNYAGVGQKISDYLRTKDN